MRRTSICNNLKERYNILAQVLTEEHCLHNFIRLDDAFFTLSQYIISFFQIITYTCLSHSFNFNACKFVSNGAILIELFTIYYASGVLHQNQPFLEKKNVELQVAVNH